MALAIERAIERPTRKEKEGAARWAAAWGLLCGIRTEGVKLKDCDVEMQERWLEQACDSDGTPVPASLRDPDSIGQGACSSTNPSAIPLPAQAAALAAHQPSQSNPV